MFDYFFVNSFSAGNENEDRKIVPRVCVQDAMCALRLTGGTCGPGR